MQSATQLPITNYQSPAPLLLLLGDPGTGKSLLALHLAAQLSRAQPLPFPLATDHWPLTTSSSIICSNEDSPDTIRSRLLAANANLDLIAYNTYLSLSPFIAASSLLKYLDLQLRLLPNP